MAKILSCREMGKECDFIARGATVDEVLGKAAEHARDVHGITDLPADMIAMARSLIREEAA